MLNIWLYICLLLTGIYIFNILLIRYITNITYCCAYMVYLVDIINDIILYIYIYSLIFA